MSFKNIIQLDPGCSALVNHIFSLILSRKSFAPIGTYGYLWNIFFFHSYVQCAYEKFLYEPRFASYLEGITQFIQKLVIIQAGAGPFLRSFSLKSEFLVRRSILIHIWCSGKLLFRIPEAQVRYKNRYKINSFSWT